MLNGYSLINYLIHSNEPPLFLKGMDTFLYKNVWLHRMVKKHDADVSFGEGMSFKLISRVSLN